MKRVLVTGGTGFIGANLVRRLLVEGHDAHLAVRPQYSSERLRGIENNVQLHVVRRVEELHPMLEQLRPEWIFHLAAFGNYSWQEDPGEILRTNVVFTAGILEAACGIGFESFVHAGSSSEYGFKDHPPAESEALEPNSVYAVGKSAATSLCRFFARKHHLHIPTLRFYSVYGPFEHRDRFIPALCAHALRGTLPPLVSADTARDFLYVDDAVEALLLAATRPSDEPGRVFNIGSGKQTSIREIVRIAREEFSIKEEPRFETMPNRKWDTSCWVAEPARAREELGWSPRIDLREGLRWTMEWHREQLRCANGGK